MQKKLIGVIIISAIGMFAGCSSSEVGDPPPPGYPDEGPALSALVIEDAVISPMDPVPVDMAPPEGPAVIVGNDDITYISLGSSSCPPEIAEAVYDKNGTIILTLADYRGKGCTADLRPLKQMVSRADGKPLGKTTNVRVVEPGQ